MDPIRLIEIEVRGFFFLLTAVLAYKMLTRGIALGGLLSRKQDGGRISPERVQLLLATLALSAKYIGQVLSSTGRAMPNIGPDWLYVFGGSSAIYASVKAITTLRRR